MESVEVGTKSNWKYSKLKEVFISITNGASIKQTDNLAGIPITRIETISNSTIDFTKLGYANIFTEDYENYYLKEGDILMSHINSMSHLGKNAIVEGIQKKIIHGMNLLLLKPNESIIFPKFAKYYFDSAIFRSQINRISNQSVNQASFAVTKLKELEIPLPPLETQKRIAKILDTADALRRKDEELLKKYEDLAQAIFIDMFGDPVKNEKGWEVKKLGALFLKPVKCGPFGSALKKEEYVKKGIPVWIMDNIQNYSFSEKDCLFITEEKYNSLTSYSSSNGDIIISRAGTVGKMCVIDTQNIKSIISTNLIKLTLNSNLINPYYFVNLMKYFGKKIGRLRTGSENGFTHMNTGVLAGLEFPIPLIEKQNEFIRILLLIEKQIQNLQNKPEKLFNSLIQKAFNGEL